MKHIKGYLFLGLAALCVFWGCKSSQPITTGQAPNSSRSVDTTQVNYTLIYVIHGDANYLYHDENGKSLQADEQKMREAISVARKAKHGEVFIFHQLPEKRILWIFPQKDRQFLHYKRGQLIQKKKYSPNSKLRSLASEQRLFHKFKTSSSNRLFFLYFGHEIPRQKGISYYHSRPDAQFDTNKFTNGLRHFLPEGRRFDLTVISTCDNGTPTLVSKLEGATDFLLASPKNLHLSFIDTDKLLKLEQVPDIPTQQLANAIAKETYDRLSHFIQTAITLSVYDMNAVKKYGDRFATEYEEYRQRKDLQLQENTDCAQLPFWDKNGSSRGVSVYYKPPSFGRSADQKAFSGWGCLE